MGTGILIKSNWLLLHEVSLPQGISQRFLVLTCTHFRLVDSPQISSALLLESIGKGYRSTIMRYSMGIWNRSECLGADTRLKS